MGWSRQVRVWSAALVGVGVLAAACTAASPSLSVPFATGDPRPAALSPGPRESVSPSAAAGSPLALPSVSSRLGAPPARCPRAAVRVGPVGPYRSVVGTEPAWAGIYAELDRRSSVYRAHDAPRREYGWRVKVLWVRRPDATESVTVTGKDDSGAPLWFELAGEPPTTSLVLNPATPGTRDEGWLNWPSYAYFPRAGCYELRVVSPTASWMAVFGLGA